MHAPLSDHAGPPDVYVRTAPPPPPTRQLEEQRHVAVAVIGAGFTGLSTALHLAEAGDRCGGAGGEGDRLGRIGTRVRSGGAVPEAGTRGHPAPLRNRTRPAHRRCCCRRPRPGVRTDLPARHRMLGDALGSDLRRAFAERTARSGAPHAVLAAARRARGDAAKARAAPRRSVRRCIRRHRSIGAAATSIRSPMRAAWHTLPPTQARRCHTQTPVPRTARGATGDG